MAIQSWNPFGGMEQALFKPVPEGYVYRAPNPWLLGPARYYLVNDAQKIELAAHHRRSLQLSFLGIIIAIVIGVPLAGAYLHDHLWIVLGVSALVGLAIGLVINVLLARKVRPIVARSPVSTDRITRSDAFKLQASTFSPRFILGYAILSLLLLALMVSYALFGGEGWDASGLVGVALFGFSSIYFIALYIAKRRQGVHATGRAQP
jgi:MFS family permease